jgi:hypothetical protein
VAAVRGFMGVTRRHILNVQLQPPFSNPSFPFFPPKTIDFPGLLYTLPFRNYIQGRVQD